MYRPVTVTSTRGGLRIENRQSFVGLGTFRARWELAVEGRVVQSGMLRVPAVDPLGSVTVPLQGRARRIAVPGPPGVRVANRLPLVRADRS